MRHYRRRRAASRALTLTFLFTAAGCGDDGLVATGDVGCGARCDASPTGADADAGRAPGDAGARDLGLEDAGAPDAGGRPGCSPESMSAFASIGPMPDSRESHVVFALDGRVWIVGGWSGTGPLADVSTALATDLSEWRPEAPLPEPTEHAGLIATEGGACLVGGDDGRAVKAGVSCHPGTNDGGWTSAAPLPEPRSGHEAARWGAFVYVAGGFSEIGGEESATVFRARLDDAGRPESWTPARALPLGLSFGAMTAHDGSLYFAGGRAGRRASQSILRASIADDGELGPWEEVVVMPDLRYGATATIFDGHLWVIGGLGRNGPETTAWAWPIEPGGALGDRVAGPELPASRFGHAALALGDRLLVLGGWVNLQSLPTDSIWQTACP